MVCSRVATQGPASSFPFLTRLFERPSLKRAEQLTQELYEATRENPNLSLIRKTRTFLKKNSNDTSHFTLLKREFLALKLGIHSDSFDQNQGFEQFARENHLDHYLLHYGHKLEVDENKTIFLRSNGQHRPWSDIQKEILQYEASATSPSLPWLYGPNGVQQKDMYNWTILEPYKCEEHPSWGNRYIFEFCVCCSEDKPHFIGDHSWVRLKTPEGAMYSAGLYRPEKHSCSDSCNRPFRTKEGYLMSPDVSDFWPCNVFTIEAEITEEQFLAMKKKIEDDKKKGHLTFQIYGDNCTVYSASIGKIGGIEFDTSCFPLLLWMPKIIFFQKPFSLLPQPIQKVFLIGLAFFTNAISLLFGSATVDKNAKGASPHIKRFRDLLTPSKYLLHHPYIVGVRERNRVLKWRNDCISEEEREKRRFAVPPLKI